MRYLIVVLAAALGLAAGQAASAVSTNGVGDGRLAFTVTRNGEPIGTQVYRIDRQGNRVVVDVHTKIDFRLLWIPIYRFRHESREIWDGDRLIRMISNTNDNGNPVTLDVRADGRVLKVGSEDGHVEVDSKAVPASLWNSLVVERHSLLDTVKGTIMETKATVLGAEVLTIGGRKIDAKRYRITGDYSRDLWYDSRDGSLVRVLFEAADGSEVEFVLKS
jgi:hypothetical protein